MKNTMSIAFDASIKNKQVNIGVHNHTTDESFQYSYRLDKNCSFSAEKMAFICALNYAKENNLERCHFFTDNLWLANSDKLEYLKEKYNYLSLNWLPREFNTKADTLSKNIKHTIKLPSMEDYKYNKAYSNIVNIREYSIDSRINLIKRTRHDEIKSILEYILYGNKYKNVKSSAAIYKKFVISLLDIDSLNDEQLHRYSKMITKKQPFISNYKFDELRKSGVLR